MSHSSAPWLAGLDGTSTWNTRPPTQQTTIPTSVTHDASSLVQKAARPQRRSLSGNSIHTMKKTRSPLSPLQNNENTSVRREHAASDETQGTVQLRSKSSSPAKKTASLEWRKRLLHGKLAYGDQTDLFGPSGLENIFATSGKRQNDARDRADTSLGWIPKTCATMPSSPPPWPIRSTMDNRSASPGSNLASSPRPRLLSKTAESCPPVDLVSPASSTCSNPFDLQLSEPDIERSRAVNALDNSGVLEQGVQVNRTLGILTELEQEELSPVFVSKHTTITGKVDYTAINKEALKGLHRDRTPIEVAIKDGKRIELDKKEEDDVQGSDESIFTDGPESKLQIGVVQDLSLSENLPTGTPEPLSRFVQVQRGGYSVIGSFRNRPLSMEPSAVSDTAGVHSDALLPSAPTPPLTAAGSSTNAAMSRREAPSTPLKLFAAHDTFTSNRLLHRMTELDDGDVRIADSTGEAVLSNTKTLAQGRRQISFGDGKLNDAQFVAVASASGSSPASDVHVPGSRMSLTFRQDSGEHDSMEPGAASPRLQSLSKRVRVSKDGSDRQPSVSMLQSEHKRPPASPLKNSTPKRRRTLHASELIDAIGPEALGTSNHLQEQTQNASSSKVRLEPRDAASQRDQDPTSPGPHATSDAIDASIREATDDFLEHEDRGIVDDVLEQIEQSLTDSDPATIRERAEVVAGEVAKYTLRVGKVKEQDISGARKPSVTTQDFFREAECVMEYIRARATKKRSLLASVEEMEQGEETMEPDQSLLVPKGSARVESHMRVSREPSWEDRPRSRWREPEQLRVHRSGVSMNRVASQLRRWRESDAIEEQDVFLEPSNGDYDQEDDQHSSEIVYDQRAQIRITGPSAEHEQRTENDSRPNSQRSAVSSNETTRRSDNVGTLAPSAVAHLIGSEVGGMRFDKDKQQWVRTRNTEHKPDNGYLNVHESHITSEDDPFREISDLVVDEGSEKRRISSPARMLETEIRPNQLLPSPPPTGLPLSTRPASFHGICLPDRQLSISDTVLRPQHNAESAPDNTTGQVKSAKSTVASAVATIASDERITRVMNDAEAAVEAEHELIAAQRAANGTVTSAPEVDYLSRCQDEAVTECRDKASAQPQPLRSAQRTPLLYDGDARVPVLPQPLSNHSMIEQSEVSFMAPLPGDRMISVSLSVSKQAAPPSQHPGQIVELLSSPLKHMSTMVLSDLPEFTVHDDDAVRPSEKAIGQRFARYAAAEVKDRFTLATKELTKALTDLHPYEPYWEELQRLDIRNKSLASLHGLDSYCNGVHALNASTNKLTHLEGVPGSVRELSARANELSSLTQFSHLSNLQYVDISQNHFESLTALAGCIHLRELKADDNQISDLTPLSGSGLLRLRCRRNEVVRLDLAKGDFTSLVELDLCSNNISTVNALEHLTSLETLRLDGNILDDGFQVKDELPSLRRLSLRGCGLTSLDVSRMPNLEVLDVDDNSLCFIEGLDTLEKLQILSMRRQSLEAGCFVDVFSKPLEAHTVQLSGNVLPQLSIGPPILSLRHLELSAVGISELPKGFGLSMSNLRTLNLNSNNIKDIRPLLHMNTLHTLRLAGNRLGRLRKNAAVLVHLPSLSSIDLRDNPMTQGFYSSMTRRIITDLVCHTALGDEIDEDAEYAKAQSIQYHVEAQGAEEGRKHLLRLDEDTKLRRRVYEMLLAHSCKKLKSLDGLAFEKANALQKDHIWDRLLALGVVRKSSGAVE